MHNYIIGLEANPIEYERTVQRLQSIGFQLIKTYESILETYFYSILEKGDLQIKVLDDYDFDDVHIESETEIPKEILKELSIKGYINLPSE